MRAIYFVWVSFVFLSSGALFAGYIQSERRALALFTLVLALAWEVCRRLKWRWLASLLFIINITAGVVGLWLFSWPAWSWFALTASLIVWDLTNFIWRYKGGGYIVNGKMLVFRHLARLSVVVGLGAMLSLLTVVSQTRLSFGLALVLGALVVIGLSQGISLLKRVE